jgi:hypothetical protein
VDDAGFGEQIEPHHVVATLERKRVGQHHLCRRRHSQRASAPIYEAHVKPCLGQLHHSGGQVSVIVVRDEHTVAFTQAHRPLHARPLARSAGGGGGRRAYLKTIGGKR